MNYHPIIDRLKRIAELLPTAIGGGGIFPSGTKTITITQNGTVTEDVTNFANAEVITNVPQGVFPSGTKTINVTQNGTVTEDVTNYANVEVITNVPTIVNSYVTTTTLATHQSANVILCEIPSDVYTHINDNSFAVSIYNLTPNVLQDYDEFMVMANNNPDNPVTGSNYRVYGCGLRKTSASIIIQPNNVYYPPNSTDNNTSLGGVGKFWINGNNLMYKSASYFLAAGTYKIVFSW